MGLFGWLKGRGRDAGDPRLTAWRAAWEEAAKARTAGASARLRQQLETLALPEEEIEIEREMLDGLVELETLGRAIVSGALPVVTTGHRVVGSDICHYSAPASMPDEPAQPSGRLLLTNVRAIFAGGGGSTVPWHAVVESIHAGRDILLVRHDRERLYRFRCNAYGDAMTGAALAAHLITRRRQGSAPAV